MITRILFLVAAVMLVWPCGSPTAETLSDDPNAVTMYARGKLLMQQSDFLAAARVFRELEARYSDSENLDLFVFNRAKSEYHLGDLSEALAGFGYFTRRFAGSPHVASAEFFAANIRYRLGRVEVALEGYLDALSKSESEQLNQLILSSLTAMFENASELNIDRSELDDLAQDRRCQVIRLLANQMASRGEVEKASSLLSECGEVIDSSTIKFDRSPQGSSGLQIAVVLPMSGELQSYGNQLYDGVVIAAEICRQGTGLELELSTYDTKGDPVEAARIVSRLDKSQAVDAIIGPLTSEEAVAASAALSCGSLPMIAPAATQSSFTELSEVAFQLSPNVDLQGVRMAQYAIDELDADSVAVITPTTTDELRMSRAFAERFESLGGTVVAVEYYRSRDRDFGPYINDIKSMLMRRPTDSTFYTDAKGDTLDPDGLPVHLDCLFLPGNGRSIRQLLPQVHFYNLGAVYLGSDGWGDEAVYKLGDDITHSAVFPSSLIGGRSTDEYVKFAAAFDARYGKQPPRLAGLGYDALTLLVLANADRSGNQSVVDRLAAFLQYEGASGMISFGKHRENTELPLYRIDGGRPVSLDQVDSEADTTLPGAETSESPSEQ